MQVISRMKTCRFVGKGFLAIYLLVYRKCFLSGIAGKYLAARPVGASKMLFCFSSAIVLTKAPTKDVLPVPAYPFSSKSESDSSESRKLDRRFNAKTWSSVGSYGKFCVIWRLK